MYFTLKLIHTKTTYSHSFTLIHNYSHIHITQTYFSSLAPKIYAIINNHEDNEHKSHEKFIFFQPENILHSDLCIVLKTVLLFLRTINNFKDNPDQNQKSSPDKLLNTPRTTPNLTSYHESCPNLRSL